MRAPGSSKERLVVLDGLRGLAAPAVALFTHFQHFGGDKAAYPFNNVTAVHWLYTYSQFFVDLFFVVSGVVMTYVYLKPISSGRTAGREFFFLRLSRLYPVQLATLLVAASVEWWLAARHEPAVIYDHNDLFHFFLHLTFTNLWFERGLAYNYPDWSLCAEVFVYGLFFLYAAKAPKHYFIAAALTVGAGTAVLSDKALPLLNGNLARAMVGFFMGSVAFKGIQAADSAGNGRKLGAACLFLLALFCGVAYFVGYDAFVGGSPLPYSLVLFPLLVVACMRVEPLAKVLSTRPFEFLGNISYSVYLVHVPLQMITLTVAKAHHWIPPTTQAWFLGTYLAAILLVGTIVHYALERPARRWLRERLPSSPPARALPAAAA